MQLHTEVKDTRPAFLACYSHMSAFMLPIDTIGVLMPSQGNALTTFGCMAPSIGVRPCWPYGLCGVVKSARGYAMSREGTWQSSGSSLMTALVQASLPQAYCASLASSRGLRRMASMPSCRPPYHISLKEERTL